MHRPAPLPATRTRSRPSRRASWLFESPAAGWLAWLSAEDAALVFDGTTWRDLKPRREDRLGVGTPADDTNRLVVACPAVLFTHAGEGTQVKVNKAAPADMASLLLQTGWSGRAEIGTAGDYKLHVKVSADGAVWTDALVVDSATGHVGIGTAAPAAALELVAATVSPSRGIVNTQITANAAAALAAFRRARGPRRPRPPPRAETIAAPLTSAATTASPI